MQPVSGPESAASLRQADASDADPIRDLVAAAYGHYIPLIGRKPMPMLADYSVAIREHDVWVLEAAGAIAGVLETVSHDDHLWIENIAITPGCQGRGFGRRLLDHAEREARRRGLSEVRLLTNERWSDNIAWYTRSGYLETHREPRLGTDVVHFRKVLDAHKST